MDIPSYILGRIKGSGGAGVSYVVVEQLPQTGEEGIIYLVPKTTSKTNNIYNEYMWINSNWELIGDTQADLTDYVKNTDYATSQKGGVVKISGYGVQIVDGTLKGLDATYSDYINGVSGRIIDKGTLENVIEGKGLVTQVNTLPTASSTNEGRIYQYTGTTTNDYINGYFYQCVSDGEDPATYSWENINVQASSGGSNVIIITDENGLENQMNINSEINENAILPIKQNISDLSKYTIFYKKKHSNTGLYDYLPLVYTDIDNINGGTYNLYFMKATTTQQKVLQCYVYRVRIYKNYNGLEGYTQLTGLILGGNNGVNFNKLLFNDNTQSYTPTGDYNPANKKYVDDKPATYTGYDATKTQVLKNINGTLTWVDET